MGERLTRHPEGTTRGEVLIIYVPESAGTTQPESDGAPSPTGYGGSWRCRGCIVAKVVASREASVIGCGIAVRCGLVAVVGIVRGSGSHAHRDTISMAIVTKSGYWLLVQTNEETVG